MKNVNIKTGFDCNDNLLNIDFDDVLLNYDFSNIPNFQKRSKKRIINKNWRNVNQAKLERRKKLLSKLDAYSLIFDEIRNKKDSYCIVKLDKIFAENIMNYCIDFRFEIQLLVGEYRSNAQNTINTLQKYGLLIKCPATVSAKAFKSYMFKLMKNYDRTSSILIINGLVSHFDSYSNGHLEGNHKQSAFTSQEAAKLFTKLQFKYYKESQFHWLGVMDTAILMKQFTGSMYAG